MFKKYLLLTLCCSFFWIACKNDKNKRSESDTLFDPVMKSFRDHLNRLEKSIAENKRILPSAEEMRKMEEKIREDERRHGIVFTDIEVLRQKYSQYSKETQKRLIEIDRDLEKHHQMAAQYPDLYKGGPYVLDDFYEDMRQTEISNDPHRKFMEEKKAEKATDKKLEDEQWERIKQIPPTPNLKATDNSSREWIARILAVGISVLFILGIKILDEHLRERKKYNDERRRLSPHIRNQKSASKGILYDWYQKLFINGPKISQP